MINLAIALTCLCLVALCGLVYADYKDSNRARALCKITASTAFVLLVVSLNAVDTNYGRLILVALVLSWVGDVCLLSSRTQFFLGGLAAFLLAHVSFSIAFWTRSTTKEALVPALVGMAIFGAVVVRWLWGNLNNVFKVAVLAYVVTIVGMGALAITYSAWSGAAAVAVGALLFVASDVFVARERFMSKGFINRAVGLPLYYVAQLVLAWTVRYV